MALSKSIGEVRALPYPEYHAWELFYLLEPFGFENDEYHYASLLSMLYNVNRGKGKAKDAKEFMRDMHKAVLGQLVDTQDPAELSRDELIKQIKKDMRIK